MASVILLPYYLNFHTVDQLQAETEPLACCQPTDVVFDFSNLRFIEPSGVTYPCNVWRELESCGHKIACHSVGVTEAIKYLDNADFFKTLRRITL